MKLKDLKAGDKFKVRFSHDDDIFMLTDEKRVNDYENTTTMLTVDVKSGQVLRFDHCAEVDKVDEKNEKENKRWRAEKNGVYYTVFILDGYISTAKKNEDYYSMDDTYYSSGNYFRTEEEAEHVANEIKVLFKEAHNRQERKNDENSNNSNSSV